MIQPLTILLLFMVSQICAYPLKIGYNDPGQCDTQGTSLDYCEDATPTYQMHLVGGVTKSQNLLMSDSNSTCLEIGVPFIQIYEQEILQQTFYFDEKLQVGTTLGFFNSISTVQWMIDTDLNQKSISQFAAVLIFQDQNGTSGQTGNTLLIYVKNKNYYEIKKVFNINDQMPSLLVLRVIKSQAMISTNDADKSDVFWFQTNDFLTSLYGSSQIFEKNKPMLNGQQVQIDFASILVFDENIILGGSAKFVIPGVSDSLFPVVVIHQGDVSLQQNSLFYALYDLLDTQKSGVDSMERNTNNNKIFGLGVSRNIDGTIQDSRQPLMLFIINTFATNENLCKKFSEISVLKLLYLDEERIYLKLVGLTIKNGAVGANNDLLYPLLLSSSSQNFQKLNSVSNNLHSFQIPINIECSFGGIIKVHVGSNDFTLTSSQSELQTYIVTKIKEEYWTETSDLWGLVTNTDTSFITNLTPTPVAPYERYSDFNSIFGPLGNDCENYGGIFRSARYSFLYESSTNISTQISGTVNMRASIYIDGIKFYGSKIQYETFDVTFQMTKGFHQIVIITFDTNNFCG